MMHNLGIQQIHRLDGKKGMAMGRYFAQVFLVLILAQGCASNPENGSNGIRKSLSDTAKYSDNSLNKATNAVMTPVANATNAITEPLTKPAQTVMTPIMKTTDAVFAERTFGSSAGTNATLFPREQEDPERKQFKLNF